MSSRAELIETLSHERALLAVVLETLPDAYLDLKGVVGAWSIKNVLAHLTAWEGLVVETLPKRLSTGLRPQEFNDLDDADAWNALQVSGREGLTPREQLAAFQQVRQNLLQLIETVGDEMLQKDHPWPAWDGTLETYILSMLAEHETEHREEVLTAIGARQEL